MTFVIKSKPDCPFCVKAKATVADRGEPVIIQEYDTPELVAHFKHAEGFKTFPQVFHNGRHIGGSDALDAYLEELDF